MRIKLFVLFAILVVFAAQVVWAGFIDERPWLAERSAWSETVEAGKDPVGWWAVGNSRVFGIVGPNLSDAQIHQITGPHIMLAGVMNNGSAFGPARLNLTVAGKPAVFSKQTLSKVRGTDIVLMEYTGADVSMTVINYAPFDINALIRTVIIKNNTNAALNDVVLTATIGRVVVKDGMLFDTFKGSTDGNAMGQTRQMFASFVEPCDVSETVGSEQEKIGTLTAKIGSIPAGGEVVRTQFLAFSMKEIGDEAATITRVKIENTQLLRKTFDDWKNWLAGTTTLDCDDRRLVDLLDDNKILVKIQTADPQGAAGPMEFFAGVWVRDSCGPFRYYLRMGNFEAARKMLEFYYRGTVYNKSVSNWKPMDIDLTQPIPADFDWNSVPTDRVETPSWLILQHAWYYAYTGDLEPIKSHWPYLKRCLMGQLYDEKGQPFTAISYNGTAPVYNKDYRFQHHGDETWIYPGFEVLNSVVFPEPNDHVHWDQYSTDSTWEFVTSAEVLTRFAKLLGKSSEVVELEKIAKDSRAALERDYWMQPKGFYAPAMDMRTKDLHQPPFTMVNLNALWIGYHNPDNPRAISNVLETMKYTMNPNYVTDATETLRVYVGMQPGLFLYNLAAIDHPFAPKALRALVEVASPTGEYTEKQVTDPKGYDTMFWGHRIRPWEGGINADAAFFYLTGLAPDMGNGRISLCPRLPEGCKSMSVTGQKVGSGKIDIYVSDTGTKRSYKLLYSGSNPIAADLKISLPQCKVSSVVLNGKPVKISTKNNWGITTGVVRLTLEQGKSIEMVVSYAPEKANQYKVVRERYKYIVPDKVPYHDIVFWSSEPRKSKPTDMGPYDYMSAKAKVRLISPNNPCDASWLRPFLLTKSGKLNTSVFFMGPNSITNSLKYQKWWGDPALTKLFTDFMNAGGIIVSVKGGEPTSDWFGKLFGDSSYFIVPTPSAPISAAGSIGSEFAGLLGLSLKGEKRVTGSGMHVYKNLAVLAHPESEPSAAAISGKSFGKGFWVNMLIDLDAQQIGELGAKLAKPEVINRLRELFASAKVDSVKGAFEDYAKDGGFSDDFKSYTEGSVGLPVWLPLSGIWKMEGSEYHEYASAYDLCSTANAKLKGDVAIEFSATLVDGIYEPGIVFNMPTRFSIARSQMVRFCGGSAVWCGPIVGGFTLEHSLPTGANHVPKSEYITMKVLVYNSRGTYDVLVNDKVVGKDLKLTVRPESSNEGYYFGLISCRGHVAFKYVKVTPL